MTEKDRPTILLTNDDGYLSEGISVLRERLSTEYRVYLVAPDRERSAVSMALTLNRPLRVKEFSRDSFCVNGTPIDCVNLALHKILPTPPDFIVSGMNFGENISFDVFFSGTVAGAFSGHLYGIPAMAVSLIPDNPDKGGEIYNIEQGADISLRVLRKILPRRNTKIVYNLNIPFRNNGKIMVTSMGYKKYKPDVEVRKDPRGKNYYWLGTGNPVYHPDEGTDVWALQNGYISLSVIKYDLNCRQEQQALTEDFDEI